MTKKYKLTKESKQIGSTTHYRIEALKDFGSVEKGDKGGWIEKETNLSQEGNAWVSGDARVFGNAQVYGDALVSGNARVYGNALVYGNAWVFGNARVSSNAQVYGNARVFGNAWVFGNARVFGNIKLKSGWFFGFKKKDEELNTVDIDDTYQLIYKGEAEFGGTEVISKEEAERRLGVKIE